MLPLLGVPVAVKVGVDVAGEVTTYGSGGHHSEVIFDVEVVRRLRAVGAVIIGKTAVPELMMLYAESLISGANPKPVGSCAHGERPQRR
ncbi:amidase family protein [Mycobacterium leprae]